MPYVILGIIILIVSFVVALISLVYEQRRVEGRKAEVEEEDSIVEAGGGTETSTEAVEHAEAEEDDLRRETDVVLPERLPAGEPVPSVQARQDTGNFTSPIGEEEVWWNTLVAGSSGTGNTLDDSEEQKSIRAIQAELAKIVSDKSGGLNAQGRVQEKAVTGPYEAKKRDFLVGEFSLDDIRGRD